MLDSKLRRPQSGDTSGWEGGEMRIHAPGPWERSCEQQEGCRVLFLMLWATAVHNRVQISVPLLALCVANPKSGGTGRSADGWCECGSAQMW